MESVKEVRRFSKYNGYITIREEDDTITFADECSTKQAAWMIAAYLHANRFDEQDHFFSYLKEALEAYKAADKDDA